MKTRKARLVNWVNNAIRLLHISKQTSLLFAIFQLARKAHFAQDTRKLPHSENHYRTYTRDDSMSKKNNNKKHRWRLKFFLNNNLLVRSTESHTTEWDDDANLGDSTSRENERAAHNQLTLVLFAPLSTHVLRSKDWREKLARHVTPHGNVLMLHQQDKNRRRKKRSRLKVVTREFTMLR